MASKITNQGLLRIGRQASESTGYDAARNIQTMSVDDSASAFVAGDTTLGSPANQADQVLDATPTESSQTISHVCTFATGAANFTIRRISLHDDVAASVSGSSSTLVGGIDGQSITKTSDFTLAITVTIAYSDAS